MKICLTTGGDGSMRERESLALRGLAEYAEQHGYCYHQAVFKPDPERAVQFSKLTTLLELLDMPDYDWLVWLDSDCVITAPERPLDKIIETWSTPATNCIVAQDWHGMCTCVVMLRNCEWSRQFLECCLFMGTMNIDSSEQDQSCFKFFHKFTPKHIWRFSLLPTDVVADQTIVPIPRPWVWHLSMGKDTVTCMQHALAGVAAGKFEQGFVNWPRMKHGIVYKV